jgi:hypothetical protein
LAGAEPAKPIIPEAIKNDAPNLSEFFMEESKNNCL